MNMIKTKKFLESNRGKVLAFLRKPFKPNWKRILIFFAIPISVGIIADHYSGCYCEPPTIINAYGYIIMMFPYSILDGLIWVSGVKPPIFNSEFGYFINNNVFLLILIVWWYVLSGLIISGFNKLNFKKLFNGKKISEENK